MEHIIILDTAFWLVNIIMILACDWLVVIKTAQSSDCLTRMWLKMSDMHLQQQPLGWEPADLHPGHKIFILHIKKNIWQDFKNNYKNISFSIFTFTDFEHQKMCNNNYLHSYRHNFMKLSLFRKRLSFFFHKWILTPMEQ